MSFEPASAASPHDDADPGGVGPGSRATPPGQDSIPATQCSKWSSRRWEPPTPEELQKLLPQYEVTKVLGLGGMGAVYQGRQISLDRPVAIKILSAELEDSDTGFTERFKNEARAMAKLNHPGIVAVYDFGERAGGLLYIVMEYVEGTDVARMIASKGRLPTEHAMAITAHVCDALTYAHERGIIHRDIKPANIMVSYDGVVKVADFGLAKVHSGSAETLGLTQSGWAIGTMHYMAPEALVLGSSVDHRADIYAVGVMLYQMLTGKVPHGMFELPSLQVAGLDPRYDRIIAKALREDRDIRYQSAGEMRADLDGILTQPVLKVEPQPTKPPATLPPTARPHRPGARQPYRSPQPVGHAVERTSKSGRFTWASLVVLALVSGGWWFGTLRGTRDRGSEPVTEMPVAAGQKDTAPTALAAAPSINASAAPTTPPEVIASATPKPAASIASTSLVVSGTSSSALARATKDNPYVNTLGMLFVPVPITGGQTDGQQVLFSKWETRVQDYEVFVRETNCDWPNPGFTQGPTHPAVSVNWEDAQAFCAWLTERERNAGKLSAPDRYRLPSDHEWSCAAGIGQQEDPALSPKLKDQKITNVFPWGSVWPPPPGAGNFAAEEMQPTLATGKYPNITDVIYGYQDGWVETAPVGSFPANSLGLHDLSGNAWEWCEDWWSDASYKDHSLRGGSWVEHDRAVLLTSKRHHDSSFYRRFRLGTGFRCVLSPSPPAAMVAAVTAAPAKPAVPTPTIASTTPASSTAPSTTSPASAETSPKPRDVATWTDTNGRRLVAKFKGIEGDNVLLEIAGRAQPVPMKTLSEASKQLAGDLQRTLSQAPAATESSSGTSSAATFTNTLGMKFVAVPITGGPTDGKVLFFCIHETRKGDYAAYARANKGTDTSWSNVQYEGVEVSATDDHPVVNVNRDDADGFCTWLSAKEGRIYRLPSDHEWSCAVGIGQREDANAIPKAKYQKITGVYPWGQDFPPRSVVGNFADDAAKAQFPVLAVINGYVDGHATTAPVMSFQPNELGVYDLAGNVWEWCQDWYSEQRKYLVIRGGSWKDNVRASFLSSDRGQVFPDTRRDVIGFRCVMVASSGQPSAAAKAVPTSRAAPARSIEAWIDSDGRTVQAEFVRIDKGALVLNVRGKEFPIPLYKLSAASRKRAEELAKGER